MKFGNKAKETEMKQRTFSGKELAVAASEHIKERDYWLKKLAGPLKKCCFPCDYQEIGSQEPSINRVNFDCDEKIVSRLMWLSNESDHTVHMILVAGVTALLYRYTGAGDLIIGSPIYKQDVQGEFINTLLPLRNPITAGMTFKELVKQVVRTTTEAVEHQSYPMEILMEQVEWEDHEEAGNFPLWDTLVLLENIHDKAYIKHIRANLTFSFARLNQSLEGVLEYNEQLYDKKTIRQIILHFKNLLEKVLFDADRQLSHIDILGEQEKQRILLDFNATGTPYPRDKTLHRLFQEQAEQRPHHIALVGGSRNGCLPAAAEASPGENPRELHVTYRELNRQANQLAWPIKKKGVGPDCIVGIMMERSIQMITGILAILKSGAAYLPIDPDYPQKRVTAMLKDANARILLTGSEIAKKYSFTALQGISFANELYKVTVTPPRPQILDFQSLPLPDRSLVNYEIYNRYIGQGMAKHCIALQATRGCPYKCAYCHKIWPKHHVFRSAEHIFAEIQLLYNMGIHRFSFIDDIFNLNRKNSRRLFELIIEHGLEVQIFFPNGVRGDLLSKEYIDLMIKAGTVNMAFALETASPRLQKLIGKNLNLEKFRENLEYICQTHPQLIIELFTMHGYPSETREEAHMTLDFIKSIKWLHFPYVFVLKVYPNTDMEKLALANGVTRESILSSMDRAFHELPDTLPFEKRFTLKYQSEFTNEYFLCKERLRHVLPHQVKVLTEGELVKKYNSYLPIDIHSLQDLLEFAGIAPGDFDAGELLPEDYMEAVDLNRKMQAAFSSKTLINTDSANNLRVLLLDLSQYFTADSDLLSDLIEPPLGLMYLLTYLKHCFGSRISGKIAKSMIDFDNYSELKDLILEFNPHLIGIRTLSLYKDFFHTTVSMIRQWGVKAPIVAGGPYATSAYQAILQDPNIDLVVLGEGELTLAQLVEKMLEAGNRLPGETGLKNIKGIAFIPAGARDNDSTAREVLLADQLRDQYSEEYSKNPEPVNHPGDLAYSIFTSGSTGTPKGILTSHANAVRVVTNTNYIQLDETHRLLQLSNYAFDGSIFDIYGALCSGGVLVLMDKEEVFNLDKLARLIKKQAINVFFVTTALFNTLVEMEPDCFKYIQKVLFGGERVSMAHTRKALRYMGKNRILHMYGPTETTVYATYYNINRIENRWATIPIGVPLSNTTVYILDPRQALVPVGAAGELYVGGDSVARGYLNNPELTSEKFLPLSPGFYRSNRSYRSYITQKIYRTGDLTRWLVSGNIEFIGRIDHQVKIRGFRIELGEIENHLLSLEEIKEAVVLTKENQSTEKSLAAYVVLADSSDAKEFDALQLKNRLSRQLPDYMIPTAIIPLEQVPLSPNGKIDRRALSALGHSQGGTDHTPPSGPLEETLVRIWAEVLKIEPQSIGVGADFFELGGHSLKVTVLASRINKEFHVEFPIDKIFNQPTIRAMAHHIKSAARNELALIPAVEKKEYYPLSSAQKRLFFLDQFEHIGTSYHVYAVYTMEGTLDKVRFAAALEDLINRHETLRTSFIHLDDTPVQRIHDTDAIDFRPRDLSGPDPDSKGTGIEKIIAGAIQPFDLACAPLMQVKIVSRGTNRHILLFDAHHIIYDGSSMAIIIGEFARLYAREKLPLLEIQYKDFTGWQNQSMESEKIKEQEEYWERQLAGELPVLRLPTDFPRPRIQSYEGDRLAFELDNRETAALKTVALAESATLFMALLALLNVLLSKLASQEDIVVGVPVAGRRHAALHGLVGMFVNSLVLRNHPRGEKSFRTFLKEVRQNALKAFENQDCQFETLVEKLSINRDTSRNPIFDVKFVMQNVETAAIEIPGLTFTPYPFENKTTKFDLSLDAFEVEEKIVFQVEYCTRLFKKESIERFTRYFKQVVTGVLADMDQAISRLSILTDKDRKQVLEDFNSPGVPFPHRKLVHQLLEDQVEKTADVTAVVCGEEYLSYGQVEARANQLAHYLHHEKNIRPGESVGVLLDRGPYLIPVIQGILKAGAAYLPLHPSAPEERLKYIIDDTCTGIVISQEKYLRTLNRLQWSCSTLHTFLCMDTRDIFSKDEQSTGGLMDRQLWNYVAESSVDEITEGGWFNSFTGKPFTREEMQEYAENLLEKLTPLLHQQTRVLEIGCGSGISMYTIAPHVGSYYGTDLSPVIVEKNRQRAQKQSFDNITLQCVPAHQIGQTREKNFDLIILNSVIHCFPGHNYFRKVIGKSISLLKNQGYIFIGDIMDLELKDRLSRETASFKQAHRDEGYRTKTDWSSELFLSRAFFRNLLPAFPVIRQVEFSRKICRRENELTRYRYDALLRVDKSQPPDNALNSNAGKYQQDMSHLENLPVQKPGLAVTPDQLAYIIYTSGSTGTPKGTMIEHSPVLNRLNWMQRSYPLASSDVILQKTPLIFDVSIWELFWWTIPGASLCLLEPEGEKNPETIITAVEKSKVTVLHFVPSMLGAFLTYVEDYRGTRRLKSLKWVFASGETLRHHHVEKFKQWLYTTNGTPLINLYGPTEATVDVSYFNDVMDQSWEAVPIGKPIDNIQLFILDEYLRLMPVGIPGELCISGVGLARGYLNLPGLTAEKFSLGEIVPAKKVYYRSYRSYMSYFSYKSYYRTGDLARWMPDGNIQFLGRLDQQVKIRGFRIEPGEIENRLLKRQDIAEALVIARERQVKPNNDNDPGDHYLCAYIVAHGPESPLAKELSEDLSRELPGYMVPDYFVTLEKMPLTASGKVNRRNLPLPRPEHPGERFDAPADSIEARLVELWSELLGIEKRLISTSGNFFELGGHSLKATLMMSRIHKEFQAKVPLTVIFKSPTVKGLTRYIRQNSGERYTPIEVVSPKEFYVLSSAQKRLFTLQQMEPESTNYNLVEIVVLQGALEADKPGKIFKQLIRRHESLRTSFEIRELQPVQKIHHEVEFEIEYHIAERKGQNTEQKEERQAPGAVNCAHTIKNFIRPFDLSRAPLIRVELVKLAPQKHLLMMDIHHIISDGISINIFVKEFMKLYQGETLPPLPIQYKDYAEWQNSEKQKKKVKKQEEYWLRVFSGEIPRLELPTDYPRPGLKNYQGQRLQFDLNKTETDALNRLALEENATLYMVLLAVLNILLYRLSGQEDIVVGTAISGRHHADLHGVIGMFVNTLAVRNYPTPAKTFRSFLKEVRENALQAFENQDYQFEELVSKLGTKRRLNRHPLFDIGFGLENFEITPLDLPGITLEPYSTQNLKSKFDISMVGTETPLGLYFRCEYSTELFKEETMKMFIKNFKSIITSILQDRDTGVEDIRLSHDLLLAKSEVPLMELEF
jgi:amino acid adenylation domain-containing protein